MSETVEKKGSKTIWWILGLIIIGVGAYFFWPQLSEHRVSVREFEKQITEKVNRELENKDNDLRKLVEQIHLTVNVKQAAVSGCRVFTKDGTDIAGNKGENVKSVDLQISTLWDGIIHKDGKTIFQVTLEDKDGKMEMTNHKIVHTDALLNLADRKLWVCIAGALALIILI